MDKLINTRGKIWYGMHFYPGVAQYENKRVFLNEETIRSMDPTFAGCPVFVEHVDEVDPDINELRKEADGWVIESFFNSADGKHWVKFVTVTDRAEKAIKNGMRLSNAYIPKAYKTGGLWNGVSYKQEISQADYEHLAIVRNPRYEESVIMDPEEFKKYNSDNITELKKISNSIKKGTNMSFSFFKKTKVENAIDPELQVILPKSKRTVSLAKLLTEADVVKSTKNDSGSSDDDSAGESAKSHAMANMDHMVKMHDGSYMKVKDMMSRHQAMCDELEDMKKSKDSKKNKEEKELDLEVAPSGVDAEGDLHNDPDSEHEMDDHEEAVAKEEHAEEMKDDLLENPEEVVHDDDEDDMDMMEDSEDPEEDKQAKKKALQLAEHEEKEIEEAKAKNKKKNVKKNEAETRAERLRNAHLKVFKNDVAPQIVELSYDRLARGKARYGT